MAHVLVEQRRLLSFSGKTHTSMLKLLSSLFSLSLAHKEIMTNCLQLRELLKERVELADLRVFKLRISVFSLFGTDITHLSLRNVYISFPNSSRVTCKLLLFSSAHQNLCSHNRAILKTSYFLPSQN